MTNELKTFYEVFLKPNLTILEEQRKSIISKLKTISIIYGIFMIIAVLVLWILSATPDVCVEHWLTVTAIIFTMILCSWETWYLYKKLHSDYEQNFKQIVIRPLVRFVDNNLNYEPNRTILLKDFYASRFFKSMYGKKNDIRKGEDYVEGTLGKISIAFSEVNALEKEGSTRITIFRGLFFKFNFNLNFKGVTMVSVHEPDIMGLGKLWPFKDDDKIPLDDPDLNRNIAIYSNNPAMVSQFFNNNFLHHLLTFYRRIKLPIYLSLVDGKLYLAISSNLFEVPLFKPVSFELINESFEYLQVGIEIVEMVKDTKAQLSQPPIPNFSTNDQLNLPSVPNFSTNDQLDSHNKLNFVNSIRYDINLTPYEQFKVFYETYLTPRLTTFEKQREVIEKQREVIIKEKTIGKQIFTVFMIIIIIIFMIVTKDIQLGNILEKLFGKKDISYYYRTNFKIDIIGSIVKFVDNIPLDHRKNKFLLRNFKLVCCGKNPVMKLPNGKEKTTSKVS